MRLLRLDSNGVPSLTKDLVDGVPPYAILSHTWGKDEDEVTFDDLEKGLGDGKAGHAKIQFCGRQAQKDGLEYFWVDTCCINKPNNTELQEAITSMFSWYRNAVKCYVYLSDVSVGPHGVSGTTQREWEPYFRNSQWFKRGWTLQELLAPKVVEFYCKEEELLGDRKTLEDQIHEITGIPKTALRGSPLSDFSVSERMLWAANRSTKKIEDGAYSLLGIFEIFMPLIYGEGDNALIRLQNEIDNRSKRERAGSSAPPDHVHWMVTRPTNALFQGLNDRLEGLEAKLGGLQLSLHAQLSRPNVSLERIISWLNAVFTDEEFDVARSSRTPGTCDWILQRPAFLNWATTTAANVTKILWIHGPAGFGKTFLCARIVQYLQSEHPGKSAYFFCVSEDESKRLPLAIVRTWVAQMVRQSQAALDAAQDAYRGKEGRSATTSDVWQLFRKICQLVANCFFIVDGFDECEKLRTSTANDFLQGLSEFSKDTSSHILFVSREDADVRSQLLRAAERSSNLFFEYEISMADTQDDVKSFSASIIDKKLYKRSSVVREEIAEQISQRSSGMFLWVRLVGDRLNFGKNAKQLREMVNETPIGIERTYERDLKRIMELGDERDRAISILRWTLFAVRPLTVRELTEALVVDPDDDGGMFPKDDLPDTWEPEEVNDQIRRLCGSLIELRGRAEQQSPCDESVHFVHFSVREYLLRTTINFPSLGNIRLSHPAAEHDLLSRICLRYICYPDLHVEKDPIKGGIQKKVDEYGFLPYAAQFWFVHAREIKEWSEQLVQLTRFFFEPEGLRWMLWSQVLEVEDADFDLDLVFSSVRPMDLPPLYYASWLGFMHVLQDLRSQQLHHHGTGEIHPGALHAAARNGHLDTVMYLVEQGANVNSKVLEGRTALFFAAYYGHFDVVSFLIKQRAEVNVATSTGDTPLHVAAADGCFDIVSILVQHGAEVDAKRSDGITSLALAAEGGHHDTVSFLIKQGAEVDGYGEHGFTLLHRTSLGGHLDTCKVLVSCGADVKKKDLNGFSPLHLAAFKGHLSILKFLAEKGARVNEPDEANRTPLHFAVMEGYTEVVVFLVNHGACMDSKTASGWTPLHLAAFSGHLDIVTFLIDRGTQVKKKESEEEMTPLCLAASIGHLHITKYLSEQGADVNAGHMNGSTPLSMAAYEGYLDIVIFLVRQGAEVNARNNDNATALHAAAIRGHLQVAQFLIQERAEVNALSENAETPLHAAITNSHFDVAKLLIDHGAEVHAENKATSTLLHSTVTHGSLDVAMSLVKQGVELDIRDKNYETTLHCAATNGHLDMVAFLIKKGVEINAKNKNGWAPVHLAAYYGHFDVLSFLLKQGVDVNLRTDFGWTCLHAAIAKGHVDVAEFLVTHGSDVNASDDVNQTPLHNGAEFGQLEAVKFLVRLNCTGPDHSHPIVTPAKVITDLDYSDILSRRPIHVAIHFGHTEIAGFLAEHDADVFCLDGYGRSALDWACVRQAIFPQFDKYWPSYVPTPEARVIEALHLSTDRLSRRLLDIKLPRTIFLLSELGHCRMFLGKFEDARFCFQQQILRFDEDGRPAHDAYCNLCHVSNIAGSRFVCQTCPNIDLCAACMQVYPGNDQLPLCQNHEFLEVS